MTFILCILFHDIYPVRLIINLYHAHPIIGSNREVEIEGCTEKAVDANDCKNSNDDFRGNESVHVCT